MSDEPTSNQGSRKRPRFRPRILELFGRNRESFSLGSEVTAGVTVGLIALPLALALGIASVPSGVDTPLPAPALGIFTAIIAGLMIAALGGESRANRRTDGRLHSDHSPDCQ